MVATYGVYDHRGCILVPDFVKTSSGGGSGVNFTSFNPTTAKELFDNAERIKVGSAFAFTSSKNVNANYYYPSDVITVSNTKFITNVSMETITRYTLFRGVVNRVSKSDDGSQYTFYLSGQIDTASSNKTHNVGGENVNIQVLSIVTPQTVVVRRNASGSYTVKFNGWYINLTQMPATMTYTSWFRDYYATFNFSDITDLIVSIIE